MIRLLAVKTPEAVRRASRAKLDQDMNDLDSFHNQSYYMSNITESRK